MYLWNQSSNNLPLFDDYMRYGLKFWPRENLPPANHLIITRDFNFYHSEVSALQRQDPGCSIFLAYPDGDAAAASCAANFVPIPKHVWKLSELLRGGPPDGCEVETVSTPLEDGEVDFPCPNMPIQSPLSSLGLDLLGDATASVWWDIDSCPVPSHCDAAAIPNNISFALGCRPLTIFADTSRIPCSSWVTFRYSMPEFKFVPARYTSEDMMDVMRKWAKLNPAPAICLLISGNGIFDSILDELSNKGYEILVAHPDGDREGSLASKASCVWDWSDLSHGESPYSGCPTSPPRYNYVYSIFGGDSDYEIKNEEDFDMKREPDYETKEEDFEMKRGRKRCRTCGSDVGGVNSMLTV
ncbi:hypothetical protein OROMI_012288 [Orobanche minor]